MEFISKKIDDYVCEHTEKESELLYALNRETNMNVLRPRMLSGHFQGRVLSMLSHMIQPKDILEIGTYTGYSALCLAEGLVKGGHLITIDKNEELEELVNEYVSKSEFKDQIKCVIGDAMTLIPGLKREFDIVFIMLTNQIISIITTWFLTKSDLVGILFLTMYFGREK